MAKKAKTSIPDDAQLTNNNLVESFSVLEAALKDDTAEMNRITMDIRILQSKLKKLHFMGCKGHVNIEMENGYNLGWSFGKKHLFVQPPFAEGIDEIEPYPLLSASIKLKKDAHAIYLPKLLIALKEEFELCKDEA